MLVEERAFLMSDAAAVFDDLKRTREIGLGECGTDVELIVR